MVSRLPLSLRNALMVIVAGAIALYVASVGLLAINAAVDNDGFPEILAVKLEALPVIFPVHMVSGGLALFLVPAAYFTRRKKRWHRPLGWLTVVDILVATITALPVAWTVPVTPWAGAGFIVQAILWGALLLAGLWSIKLRDFERHRMFMLLMAAVTSGALFFRINLGLWGAFADRKSFLTFYSYDAWIGWAAPLLIAAYWLIIRRKREALSDLKSFSLQ